ncbi:hypothetical protein CH64_1075 [Yersinia rohdei]|uniref:Uncharacterized protein n=1 Tax=Yersinia rohdei TaxID=29485 RepID=A0A0U1HN56_YERRO|nr:hypothetical protein [Yersinia rohdei]AJJ10064.1 hypothetical protein CH64_1075 [Yersinia rohdei]MDN0093506.1 hypothetical protein [Yersinia rohdei]CNI57544.1 Uncharacterised protein [Yersinia rohdei]CQI87922.1 Uncharacterised protein [Yersinia rohdei]CQJ44840.1 Uncharacterised protein [Yersinia rohdei]
MNVSKVSATKYDDVAGGDASVTRWGFDVAGSNHGHTYADNHNDNSLASSRRIEILPG